MWIRIRAVIIEDEPLAAQYLAELLDDTCWVEVVGSATESEAGLRLCAELRPDAVFLDINLPGKDGVSLATQLACFRSPHACSGKFLWNPELPPPSRLNAANAQPIACRLRVN
jgi:DNA-binding NarL/FixJ family response regulator